jgi:putative colanic acid biosynthesis glycosyltransferase
MTGEHPVDAGPGRGAPPRLSVVTVTLNDPAGLRLTLESLRPLFDTWPSPAWEHVVVDGSPAISRRVLDDVPGGWPLVHVEESPRGVPEAFNRGLEVVRGAYVWFLNGGDGLHDVAALARLLALFERDPTVDFVGGGAYLARHGVALYPATPRRSLLANLLGRNWIYHQAVIYRRATLRRMGAFSTAYRAAEDYDYHLRCYLAGLCGRFTADILVDYDMSGGSNDLDTVFGEFKRIQRAHRAALPAWVNVANEIVRRIEYGRIRALRTLSTTAVGGRLRPLWTKANRWLRS